MIALVLAAAFAAPATHSVQATTTDTDNLWTPSALSANVGDTVEWNLNAPGRPEATHDVVLTAPGAGPERLGGNRDLGSTGVVARELTATGTYEFVCTVHSAMRGTISVGAPPPPVDPEPPAAPNTSVAPSVFEEGDTVRPTMSLRVSPVGRRVRVRVRVSEAGTLYLRVMRGTREVSTRRVRIRAGASSASVLLPRRAGRYRLAVWARDAGGLESKWRYASLRVSSP